MTEQKKMANGRYEGTNYRYSTKFINRLTGWLIAWIFIGTGLGLGIGALGDVFYADTDVPSWYTIFAICVTASGVGLPLLLGAWFGGMALNKYAGPVGLLLVVGIVALACGSTIENQGVWVPVGTAAIVLAVILFFLIGFRAKVAMWLQLPFFGSPRLYIKKTDSTKKKK